MKYQTRASYAEEHVMEMLKSEKSIIRPWSLANYSMVNRTLQTTAGEVPLLFNNHTQVRPGFEINDGIVFIPNLFVKISGFDPDLREFYDAEGLVKRDLCLFFPSLSDFNVIKGKTDFSAIEEKPDFNAIEEKLDDVKGFLDENGIINREKLLNSGRFTYSFLRIEYQDMLIKKMNDVIQNRHTYFTGAAAPEDPAMILLHLLRIDRRIMAGYNSFDFPFLPPAIVIHCGGSDAMSADQAHVLMLMNLLGFDIILVSRQGFSNIENLIKQEHYNLYYGDSLKAALPEKRIKRHGILVYSAIAVIVLATTCMLYISALPGKSGFDGQKKGIAADIKENIDKEDTAADTKKAGSEKTAAAVNGYDDSILVAGEISISGKVIDYLNNPVFHAVVEVYQVRDIVDGVPGYGSENYWNIPGWERIRTSTDSGGKFIIENFSDFKENKLHAYVLEFYIPWELQYEGQMLQNPDPLLVDLSKIGGNIVQTGDAVAKHGGSVIVEVLDENGDPYTRDISIDLRRSNDQRGFSITTCGNEKGLHYSAGLPDGSYYLDIDTDGYKDERVSGIAVKTGKAERLVVKLTED